MLERVSATAAACAAPRAAKTCRSNGRSDRLDELRDLGVHDWPPGPQAMEGGTERRRVALALHRSGGGLDGLYRLQRAGRQLGVRGDKLADVVQCPAGLRD